MVSNMENDFSQVIAELTKIDDAAENVLSNTESAKQAYSDKIKQETDQFDKELESNIKKILAEYENNIRNENEASLSVIRKETEQNINDLESWYNENHASIVKEIVADFIKE